MRGIHRWPVNSLPKGPVKWKIFPFDDVVMKSTLDQLMPWCHQVTKPLLEPMLAQIYIAIWCHKDTKQICPNCSVLLPIFISVWRYLCLSINDSMAPIMWRTIVEIRNDYDKSTLVQVVDWCCQATSNCLSQRRQNSISLYGVTRSHCSIMTPYGDIELVQHWLK